MSFQGNYPPRGDSPVPQSTPSNLPAPMGSLPSTSLGTPVSRAGWTDPNEAHEGLNFIGFMHSLRRRALVATVLGVVVATVAAGLVYYFVPYSYEAVAMIRVKRDERDILSRERGMTDRTYESYKQTQRTLIGSPYIIGDALRKPGIGQLEMLDGIGNPIAWIEEELRVDNPQESELLRISIYGDDAGQAVKLVNAIKESYMEEIVHAERVEMLTRLEVLRGNYRKAVTKIKTKTSEFIKLAELLGTSDASSIEMKRRLLINELNTANSRRDDLEARLRETSTRLQMAAILRDQVYNPTENHIEQYLMNEPDFVMARRQMMEAEEMYREVSNTVKANSPSLQRMRAPYLAARARLDRIRAELKPRIVEHIQRQYGNDASQHEQNLTLLQTELGMLQGHLEEAKKTHQKYANDATLLGGVSADIEARKDELESLRSMANVVKMEIDSLELVLEERSPRIQVIQHAVVPDSSDWLWVWSEIGGVWIIGFSLVVGGIAFWDYTGRRVNTPKDVSSATHIRVLGTLPMLFGLRTGGLWPFGRKDGNSMQTALNYSIDSIRTALLYNDAHRAVDVVMVTSATGEEGRTTLASQLAVSLARSGRRTLLLDGDMRNPQQHLVFGMPFSSGFCEMLRKNVSADEVIHTTAIENLWLLPAGYCCEESVQALSDGSLQEIFEALRSQFDFVVIDSGPALNNADPLLLGQHADATILSVRRDISQVPKIEAASERLRSVGIHVIGAVVNGGSAEVRRNELRITADASVTSESHADPETAE